MNIKRRKFEWKIKEQKKMKDENVWPWKIQGESYIFSRFLNKYLISRN